MRSYYSERLWVPASWWVIGLFFAVSFVSAVGLTFSPAVSLLASVVTAVAVAVALLAYGRRQVRVEPDGLHAGDAVLDWDAVGQAVAHDRTETSSRLGADADPAGWLFIRGYVPTSVEVTVADAGDPHPYWLISTRRPAELVAAIERARSH